MHFDPQPLIALPYTIRRMPPGNESFLPWEISQLVFLVEYAPWRSLAVMLPPIVGWVLASRRIPWPWSQLGWVILAVLLALSCDSELMNRRDRLTKLGIERRAGIFGRQVAFIPYSQVELVTVEDDGTFCGHDVGSVVLRLRDDRVRLAYVEFPHEIAQAIDEQKDAARA